MISVFGRFRLFFGLGALCSAAVVTPAGAAVIEILAVAKNGVAIPRTATVDAAPGDTITTEIFVSEWTTTNERLLSYQVALARSAFTSGTRGNIMPLGWDAPISTEDNTSCQDNGNCPTEFPVCQLIGGIGGFCVGNNHDPEQGVFINANRADWVFRNPADGTTFPHLPGVDAVGAGDSFRYAAALITANDAQLFSIPIKYCATLILKVSSDACGPFVVNILLENSSLTDQDTLPITPINTRRLNVNVTSPGAAPLECSCLNIVSTSVPNCSIDGRQPSDPDGTNPQTPNSMTFTFDCESAASIADVSNFSRFFAPTLITGPAITNVTALGSNVTVTLSGRMVEKRWNCIRYIPTFESVCVGIMPGDVGSDGRSQSFPAPPDPNAQVLNDIENLKTCLNNPGTCSPRQCDTNRSGTCGPHDLLREVDLVAGTGAFPVYDNTGILDLGGQVVACPSAP